MTEPESQNPTELARQQFEKGQTLEKEGLPQLALTEYRRAILGDPNYFDALMGVGRLSKIRENEGPIFVRYAFEAFQKAAQLDLSHQEAHDQYILMSQKMGRLDVLLEEYDKLSKANPDNEVLKRCYKNIMAISMAMIPAQVQVAGGDFGKKMRRLLLVICLGGLFFGAVLMASPIFLRNSKKFTKEQLRGFVKIGAVMGFFSFGGLILRGRFK